MTSGLLAAVHAIPEMDVIDEETKADLLYLIRAYSTVDEELSLLARTHPDVVLEVEFAHSRMQALLDEEEYSLQRLWAEAYAKARDELREEAKARIPRPKTLKPTEEQVKCRATLDMAYDKQKMRVIQLKSLANFLEGMKKGLYARSLMIRILSDREEDFEAID